MSKLSWLRSWIRDLLWTYITFHLSAQKCVSICPKKINKNHTSRCPWSNVLKRKVVRHYFFARSAFVPKRISKSIFNGFFCFLHRSFSLQSRLCPLWYYIIVIGMHNLRDLFSVNDMSLWLFLVDHNIASRQYFILWNRARGIIFNVFLGLER
jgi:hypothetical protein